jgi:tetratricopeptide (TPR) repeat protein
MTPIHTPDEWGSRDAERLLLATLYREVGSLAESIRWFGTFEHMSADDLAWAAPAHFLRAELLERLGRKREAAEDYERVVELWRDCEPEVRPIMWEAELRGMRLRKQILVRRSVKRHLWIAALHHSRP